MASKIRFCLLSICASYICVQVSTGSPPSNKSNNFSGHCHCGSATVLQCHQHRAVHWCIVRHCISLHWFEQVQEVQTRHKTQFWSSSNFVLMFKLHPIFYSVAAKCKTWTGSKYQLLLHQVPAGCQDSQQIQAALGFWEKNELLKWPSDMQAE